MKVTREMIGAAHDICLKKGDFVLSADLLERIYLSMDALANRDEELQTLRINSTKFLEIKIENEALRKERDLYRLSADQWMNESALAEAVIERYRSVMEQAVEALELRCGTNADERKPDGIITALRKTLGDKNE